MTKYGYLKCAVGSRGIRRHVNSSDDVIRTLNDDVTGSQISRKVEFINDIASDDDTGGSYRQDGVTVSRVARHHSESVDDVIKVGHHSEYVDDVIKVGNFVKCSLRERREAFKKLQEKFK